MRKTTIHLAIGTGILAAIVAAGIFVVRYKSDPEPDDLLARYSDVSGYDNLTIQYPLNETLFPPEIVPPTFRWKDSKSKSNMWLLSIKLQDSDAPMNIITRKSEWIPQQQQWETIKKRSLEQDAQITILGISHRIKTKILSAGKISIKTSKDPVDAPLFYREVNLPFIDAVKDPSNIRWRFGSISSFQQPPIILEKLPVCGNCHSFDADGKTLAMDVDYANSKASYVITQVAEQMTLTPRDIITWNDYKKEDGQQTFGLLSQISPDGRFVLSTVKDASVFVPKPDMAFSQLFFPIKGILCVYDRQTETFNSLPGADDPQYVQSNPSWSPNGKYVVFARATAYKLKNVTGPRRVLLTPEQCEEFLKDGKPFLFDLYRVPFNDGKGGVPEPIEGASGNGMSNYFAKYSPDGKWIIFCKAKSYMLLQPDSELYIIPAEGGTARKLRCNTSRMNSWHSFSPNGRWLAFSSKANSPYTQLFLTHIDEQGQSTPSVLLEHFTASDRAANIPEFINTGHTGIKKIREQFLDDYSYMRAASEFIKGDDFIGAERQCRKSLELNPKNAKAHAILGIALVNQNKLEEATSHLAEAIRLDPTDYEAHYTLGQALTSQKKFDEAIGQFSTVLQLRPDYTQAHGYIGSLLLAKGMLNQSENHLTEALRLDPNYADAHYNMGQLMLRRKNLDGAIRYLLQAVEIVPDDAQSHYKLAEALAQQKHPDQAVEHYTKAVSIDPQVDTSPLLNHLLAMYYADARQFDKATSHEEKAIELARASGYETLTKEFEKWLKVYKQLSSSPQ
ncbi:MAG: tetratricopeptide repeat protein [Sedimentisphaerales bacterium]|nr:tetratricopeptide repeat protein [Sedimentisphaerales bacterium]